MPGAAAQAAQEVYWNSHILHSLLWEITMTMDNLTKTCLMSVLSPRTFRPQIRKSIRLSLPSSQPYMLQAQCLGIFLTGQALASETGFRVCSNHSSLLCFFFVLDSPSLDAHQMPQIACTIEQILPIAKSQQMFT